MPTINHSVESVGSLTYHVDERFYRGCCVKTELEAVPVGRTSTGYTVKSISVNNVELRPSDYCALKMVLLDELEHFNVFDSDPDWILEQCQALKDNTVKPMIRRVTLNYQDCVPSPQEEIIPAHCSNEFAEFTFIPVQYHEGRWAVFENPRYSPLFKHQPSRQEAMRASYHDIVVTQQRIHNLMTMYHTLEDTWGKSRERFQFR